MPVGPICYKPSCCRETLFDLWAPDMRGWYRLSDARSFHQYSWTHHPQSGPRGERRAASGYFFAIRPTRIFQNMRESSGRAYALLVEKGLGSSDISWMFRVLERLSWDYDGAFRVSLILFFLYFLVGKIEKIENRKSSGQVLTIPVHAAYSLHWGLVDLI